MTENQTKLPRVEIESGFIYGFTNRLVPSLWLGLIPPGLTGRYSNETLAKLNKAGQFYIWHPYQGSVCDFVSLHGIFLPLATCRNKKIVDAFTKLQKKYYKRPFTSVRPNLDEVVTVRNELRIIGPLDMSYHFRTMGEAYIPFQISEVTYSWLRKNFEMMTRISEEESINIEIVETKPLTWNTLGEFTNWFYSADWSLKEDAIRTLLMGALFIQILMAVTTMVI
ncbi:MAG: hypothetical protein L6R45_16485 [Anaerolineae bacterium]|nr:hypothetical protein [Anaerolineae bacterium]